MAGKKRELSIVLKAIDKATKPLAKFNAKIVKVGANITKVGKKLTTSITLPIVAVGVASVKAFSEFETGMSNVSTLIDTTNESIEAMGETVLDIGSRVPVKMKDLTGSLFNVRSAGIAAADQFVVLERSARLGVAGLGSTEQAVDIATSAINAFGLEGQKALDIYDQVFKATKFGKTTIAELSEGFGGVAGTMAAANVEVDEFLAATAALTTTGLPAAQAQRQLAGAITGLTRKTKLSSKVFKKLGAKDLKDLIEKTGGLVPALQAVSDQVKGNDAQMLKLVGSAKALNAVQGILGKQSGTFKDALDDMRKGSVAVDDAFAKQNKTMAARWQVTKNILFATGVTIGEVLAPALGEIAVKLQGAAKWFKNLDKGTKKWIVKVAVLAATVGPAVVVLGKLVGVLGIVSKTILVVGTTLAKVGVFLLANPIVAIITAIALIATLLILHWKPIKEFFIQLWGGVKRALQDFWDFARPILRFTPIGQIIENWGPISEFFETLWGGVVVVFEAAWKVIKAIVDKLSDAVDAITNAMATIKEQTKGTLTAAFSVARTATETPEERQTREAAEARGVAGGQALGNLARTFIEQRTSAKVQVEFKNAPPGMRAEQTEGDAAVDLTTGFQMVMP